MPSSQGANLGINYGWALGESGWNVQMDENLVALDALVFLSVLSATTGTPPGGPANGDRYIIPAGASGVWAAQVGKVAQWSTSLGTWRYFTPRAGWECRAENTKQRWVYTTSWVLEGTLYTSYANDTAAAAGGVPLSGFYVNSSTGALTKRLV
jgi:hypothetical protein